MCAEVNSDHRQSPCPAPDVFLPLLLLSSHTTTAYFITTLAAAVSHLQQLEVEEGPDGGLCVRPLLPRKDSVASTSEAAGGGGLEEEVDLLERWGPSFSAEETRRALTYLDGWLAMELNMEQTIEILEKDGWW